MPSGPSLGSPPASILEDVSGGSPGERREHSTSSARLVIKGFVNGWTSLLACQGPAWASRQPHAPVATFQQEGTSW